MNIDYNYFYDETIYRNDLLTEDENIIINTLIEFRFCILQLYLQNSICHICNIDYSLIETRALNICSGIRYCYLCHIKCMYYGHQHIKQYALQKIFTRFLIFRETIIRKLLVDDVSNYIFLLSIINTRNIYFLF